MRHYKPLLCTCLLVIFIFAGRARLQAQKVIPLYAGDIPNSLTVPDQEINNPDHDQVLNVSHPTLTVFLPAKKKLNGAAVIICPGGGYGSLVINREGYAVAKAFNAEGVVAFVLKYRLPADRTMKDKSIGPLQDAQQAVKMVRQMATTYHYSASRIGLLGFSAGGHLAASAGTHFNRELIENKERVSLRPDFLVLVYPVISFSDSITNAGTKDNLLGSGPDADKVIDLSNELQVTKETPVTFLVHAADDSMVPAENSILFYEALRKNNVPAELHIYSKGEHGFLSYPSRSEWLKRCINWMKSNQLFGEQPSVVPAP